MKITYPLPRVIYFQFDSQYELTSSFIRMQEFYESPYEKIRGHYFTLEDYMECYANNHNGKMNYFTEWLGFNIPSCIFLNFMTVFKEHFRAKELIIINNVKNLLKDKYNTFYIIGTCNEKDKLHELAHALFYTNKKYMNEMLDIIHALPLKELNKWKKKLKKWGYTESVFLDEIQAYIIEEQPQSKFRKIFNKYYN